MLTRILTIILILFSFLSGCGKALYQQSETPTNLIQDPTTIAKRLEVDGNYQQAAQEYLRIAAQSIPPTQQGHQLSAIKSFLKGGMLHEAKTELNQFDSAQSYGLEIPLEFIRTKIDLEEHLVDKA